MKSKLSLHPLSNPQQMSKAERGFTLVELLVGMMLSAMVISMSISGLQTMRESFFKDRLRVNNVQNSRGIIEYLGLNVRQAGENMPPNVPAIELVDGTGTPDELILRRNLVSHPLNLCLDITAAAGASELVIATDTSEPGCQKSLQSEAVSIWLDQHASQDKSYAYIYNLTDKIGQLFEFSDIMETPTEFRIIRADGDAWNSDYAKKGSIIIFVEQINMIMLPDVLNQVPKQLFVSRKDQRQ